MRAFATRRPSSWGLFDLHGNVLEWCEDAWHWSYEGAPTDGSAWTKDAEEMGLVPGGRIVRGGGWDSPALRCRSAYRNAAISVVGSPDVGFRPVF